MTPRILPDVISFHLPSPALLLMTLAALPLFEHSKTATVSGTLHLIVSLLRSLFPQISAWLPPSFPSNFWSNVIVLEKIFPDSHIKDILSRLLGSSYSSSTLFFSIILIYMAKHTHTVLTLLFSFMCPPSSLHTPQTV